jgi:hypothetical protein
MNEATRPILVSVHILSLARSKKKSSDPLFGHKGSKAYFLKNCLFSWFDHLIIRLFVFTSSPWLDILSKFEVCPFNCYWKSSFCLLYQTFGCLLGCAFFCWLNCLCMSPHLWLKGVKCFFGWIFFHNMKRFHMAIQCAWYWIFLHIAACIINELDYVMFISFHGNFLRQVHVYIDIQ